MPSNEAFSRNSNGDPIFQDSLVLFLDLLGVSHLATTSGASQVLKNLDAVMVEVRKRTERDWGYAFAWFSDSLAVAFPVTTWHGEDELGDVLGMAQLIQFELALAGFVSRGGFTRGDVFMDDNVTFGPALVEAVGLEKAAVTPRVLLSGAVVDLARSQLKFYGSPPTWAPQMDDLAVDSGGDVFINYLDACKNFYSGESVDELKPLLDQHRQVVANGLAANRGDPAVLAKFTWLAEYHNWYSQGLGVVGVDVHGHGVAAATRFS